MAATTSASRRPAALVAWLVLALGIIGALVSCLLQARSYASLHRLWAQPAVRGLAA